MVTFNIWSEIHKLIHISITLILGVLIVFVELDKIVVLGFILTPIGVDVLSNKDKVLTM